MYWLEDAEILGIEPSLHVRQTGFGGWLARLMGQQREVAPEANVAKVDPLELDFIEGYEPTRPADVALAVSREAWSTPERGMYLRTCLWRFGNHVQRGRFVDSPISEAQAADNMRALLALNQAMEPDTVKRETVAELMRQLGRFEEAIAVLDAAGVEACPLAEAIRAAAARGETHVFKVESF